MVGQPVQNTEDYVNLELRNSGKEIKKEFERGFRMNTAASPVFS